MMTCYSQLLSPWLHRHIIYYHHHDHDLVDILFILNHDDVDALMNILFISNSIIVFIDIIYLSVNDHVLIYMPFMSISIIASSLTKHFFFNVNAHMTPQSIGVFHIVKYRYHSENIKSTLFTCVQQSYIINKCVILISNDFDFMIWNNMKSPFIYVVFLAHPQVEYTCFPFHFKTR